MTAQMAPYLLVGFSCGGVLSLWLTPAWVSTHLGQRGFLPILKASLVGVPMPLCSCGVLPVAAGLKRAGAGDGPTLAFLGSTPQTGVDSILATWSMLGWPFAVARPLIAFVTGLLCGWAARFFDSTPPPAPASESGCACCCGGKKESPPSAPSTALPTQPRWQEAIRYGFWEMPQVLAKPMGVGILISALMTQWISAEALLPVSSNLPLSMALMLAVGLPFYSCSVGSLPVAAALLAKGFDPAAVLVFLVAGPATSLPALLTVSRLMGWKQALVYALCIAICACTAGILFGHLIPASFAAAMQPPCHTSLSMINTASAVILLTLMIAPTLLPFFHKSSKP